jgi:uncharacterized membrane protein YkvA (DUF1232 family)
MTENHVDPTTGARRRGRRESREGAMNDSIRPDDVIPPTGKGSVQLRRLAGDAVTLLPNLLKLLGRVMKDPRVPRRTKLVVGAALAYLVSPIDLVPEFVPVAGVLDDLLIASFALNHLATVAGDEILLEHWDGPRDLLELVRSVLEMASDLVPAPVRRIFRGLTGS